MAVATIVTAESITELCGSRILFQWDTPNHWSFGSIKRRLNKPPPHGLPGVHVGYTVRFDAESGDRGVWLSLKL
jgi:hypothetical protein